MKKNEIIIGRRVKSLIEFSGVPKGTQGVIDEFYDDGFMVAWDLAKHLLPDGYQMYSQEYRNLPILRDGFSIKNELHYLEEAGK